MFYSLCFSSATEYLLVIRLYRGDPLRIYEDFVRESVAGS